jgi:DUF177 domain-containing protein
VKVKLNKDYIIPFVGLKLGVHEFKFNITDTFFDSFEYSIIHKGNVMVVLQLDKKETMLIGNYSISGVVEIECNRCNDPMNADIEGEYQLVYKFDTVPSDDESLIIVYPEEFEINVAENILELITVSLPKRSVHNEGECNEDMISLLDEYVMVSDEEAITSEDEPQSEKNKGEDDDDDIDPRWSALKDLK